MKESAGSKSDSLLSGCEYPLCFIWVDKLKSWCVSLMNDCRSNEVRAASEYLGLL